MIPLGSPAASNFSPTATGFPGSATVLTLGATRLPQLISRDACEGSIGLE